jgi:hypothetical protein
MKTLPQGNEYLLSKALESATGFKGPQKHTLQEQLEELDNMGVSIPSGRWQDHRVILQRPPVISGILNPRLKAPLVQLVEESFESPALVMDAMLVGVDALWVVRRLEPDDAASVASAWVSKMLSYPCMLIGSYRGEVSYIGAPVKSFFIE